MSDYVCLQSHNDALDDHRRIRMDEYKRDYRKLETRYCEKHPKEVYSTSCEKCFNVFCAGCMHKLGLCSDGKATMIVRFLINLCYGFSHVSFSISLSFQKTINIVTTLQSVFVLSDLIQNTRLQGFVVYFDLICTCTISVW